MNSHTNHDPQDEFAPPPGARKARSWARRSWTGLVIVGIVFVLAVSLFSMRVADTSSADRRPRTATVRRDDLIVTITESGTLAARKSITYTCKMYNYPTIISIVPEGTYVTPEDVNDGRVLVELDPSIAEEKLAPHKMNLLRIQADITQAEEEYGIQLTQNESDTTAAQLTVEFAWIDVQRYLGTNLSGKIKQRLENDPNTIFDSGSWLRDPNELGGAAEQTYGQLEDKITLAHAKLKRAQDTLESTRKLYAVNYVSHMELEGDALDVNSFDIQYQQAKTELELFETYDFSKQVKRLLSAYQEALRELGRTSARARGREAQARSKVENRKAQAKYWQGEANKQQRQIDAAAIRATAPGLLIYGSERDIYGNVKVEITEGAKVGYNQKVITLPDTSDMIAKVGVHESSVDKVKPGQKATITVDAFPDQTFHGEVIRIAPLPDQHSFFSSDVKIYTTEISIEGSYTFLKPGMSAKAKITVEDLNDVLIVPIQAVANRANKKECFVPGRAGPERRQVVVGAFNKSSVQIIDGLTEGEEIFLNPPWRYEEDNEIPSGQTDDPPTDEQEPAIVGRHRFDRTCPIRVIAALGQAKRVGRVVM